MMRVSSQIDVWWCCVFCRDITIIGTSYNICLDLREYKGFQEEKSQIFRSKDTPRAQMFTGKVG